jgi:hypothetical protein
MFALVETWFSSLPSTCIPQAGKTPTRAARAIACCVRGVIDAVAPPPGVLKSLQLLFAMCVSGRSEVGKAARIQAIVQMAIEGCRDGEAACAQPDTAPLEDLSSTFEFLFPTEH